MTQQELQKRLNQPYSTENWKEVVQEVFPNVQLLNPVLTIPVDNPKVESFRQLGNVRLQDGKSLALFELKLKNNVNILRNRVELNNLVSQYIDQEQNHGVLSIFEQGGEDYRFTFSARSTEFDETEVDFVTKKTDTKRFTYVLGKNESCKTPAKRLHDLSIKKDSANINTIQDAFSVEKLSIEFFAGYKVYYEQMVNYLNGSPGYKLAIFKGDEKAIRDFVKLTLGRLVFIQFLQKKRWIGVPIIDPGWNSGDPHFLKHSFQNFPTKETFYSNFLEPLFFETLNKDGRPNQIFQFTGTKVPYLNGGLFEKGKENSHLINFPGAFFEELFEFFDRYNFTIDESDPKEQEVGIDPEMLGHIFENLLEDNKDKGAFYTPKEIVHYMCQESLLEYLKTFLEEKGKWPTTEEEQLVLEEDLSNFIKKKEGAGIIDYDRELAIALRDVKICDPAIGSGAFPMGLLNEIFHAVYILFQASPDVVGKEWGMNEWKPNVVKKNIIQNSIYGVDIEKGAVDIARLRFWLSLIVDEPEPEALPNLDYKIVTGNSLVPMLGNEVIHIEWDLDFGKQKQQGLSIEDVQFLKSHFDELTKFQKKFFGESGEKKEKLKQEINRSKIELIVFHLQLQLKRLENKAGSFSLFGLSERDAKEQAENAVKIKTLKNTIFNLSLQKTNSNKELDFFDWKLNFPEIFNDQVNPKPGFDIVIANPPYIKEYTNRNAFDGFRDSPYYKGKMDIWYGFACVMLDLLKSNGVECFIAQNNWITSAGASIFRNKVLSESEIKLFTDFGNYKVFETAGIQTMIYILKKTDPKEEYSTKYSVLNNDRISKAELIHYLDFEMRENYSEKFSVVLNSKKIIGKPFTFNNNVASQILNKIKASGNFFLFENEVAQGIVIPQDFVNKKTKEKLNNEVDIGDGIFVLSLNELKGLNLNEDEKELIKPFFTTDELKRYYPKPNNQLWIIYTGSEYKNPNSMEGYPNLKQHLDRFRTVITSDNKPYGLHRAREERFFRGESIVAQRKCPDKPSFTYTDFDCYVSATFYVIQTNRLNMKYLTALLNSKLVEYWLRNKGKMQGNNFQIDKEPLLAIPLVNPTEQISQKIVGLVTEILDFKSKGKETKSLENQIDYLIFKLYELDHHDMKIIDPKIELNENEYKAISID